MITERLSRNKGAGRYHFPLLPQHKHRATFGNQHSAATHYLTCSHQALPTHTLAVPSFPVTLASVPVPGDSSHRRPSQTPPTPHLLTHTVCRTSVLEAAAGLDSHADQHTPYQNVTHSSGDHALYTTGKESLCRLLY